jgi:hypothetical protein
LGQKSKSLGNGKNTQELSMKWNFPFFFVTPLLQPFHTSLPSLAALRSVSCDCLGDGLVLPQKAYPISNIQYDMGYPISGYGFRCKADLTVLSNKLVATVRVILLAI